MKTLTINLHEHSRSYPIHIGSDIFKSIKSFVDIDTYSRIAVVTDTRIAKLWMEQMRSVLPETTTFCTVEPGEKHKSLETVQTIWQHLLSYGLDRKSLVLNFGGGVIGDMGGFTAATYMRGIDFIQIPTTLLSMVDASVGGKLGIDFEGHKNMIGSFVQPKAVIIDVATLSTLPDREFIAGFAEIIKHGIISDAEYFEKVTKKHPKEFSPAEMISIIEGSCKIKSRVIESDEKESGLRKILNFGHTVGHAVESLSLKGTNPLLHGEAIAIGMIAESKLSEILGYITEDEFKRIEHTLKSAGLPICASNISAADIFQGMKFDKKNEKGAVKWTLLKKIGEADFNIAVDPHLAEKAILYILNK